MIDVTLLLLTLNEAGNIEPVINDASKEFIGLGITYEVLVIDGGSQDDTALRARALGARVQVQEKRGYGEALKLGFNNAQGKYIAALDADCSHPPDLIKYLWAKREQFAIVVGSRYMRGASSEAPLFRKILSRLLNVVFTALLRLPIRDISSGFRLYRREVLTPDDYKSTNFDILEEVLIKVLCAGHAIGEVPLNYRARKSGTSNARPVKLAFHYLKTLGRMWSLRYGTPIQHESTKQ